jgi:DNA-binding response OmpR family regulator
MNRFNNIKQTRPGNRLLIVEDDEIFAHFLKKFFSNHNYNVTFLDSGEPLALLLEKEAFDLIILDIVLPGRDGFYWLTWLQEYYSHIPVIMSSVKTGKEHRLRGLRNGAQDYISKPFHEEELLIRIKHIFEKQPVSTQEDNFKIGETSVDINNAVLIKAGHEIPLTQLEMRLLQLLKINAGLPVTREDIITQIRGVKYNPLDRSVDVHINKLRKKLEDNPAKPRHIRTIRGKGYCLHID